MSKDTYLGLRVPLAVKTALAKAAETDGRSVSSVVSRVLYAWLMEHGYIKETKE